MVCESKLRTSCDAKNLMFGRHLLFRSIDDGRNLKPVLFSDGKTYVKGALVDDSSTRTAVSIQLRNDGQ